MCVFCAYIKDVFFFFFRNTPLLKHKLIHIYFSRPSFLAVCFFFAVCFSVSLCCVPCSSRSVSCEMSLRLVVFCLLCCLCVHLCMFWGKL